MAQQHTTAAGSGTAAVAGAVTRSDRTHFLTGTDESGFSSHTPALGGRGLSVGVCVFDEKKFFPYAVVLVLKTGPFSLQESFTTDDARVLAAALLLAADHAERRALDHDIDAAMEAAGVAA